MEGSTRGTRADASGVRETGHPVLEVFGAGSSVGSQSGREVRQRHKVLEGSIAEDAVLEPDEFLQPFLDCPHLGIRLCGGEEVSTGPVSDMDVLHGIQRCTGRIEPGRNEAASPSHERSDLAPQVDELMRRNTVS